MIPAIDISSQEGESGVPDYSGEILQYKMKYGIFNIGKATISCLEDPSGCGYRIKAEARSTGFIRTFRKLHYRLECCMDPLSGLPNSALLSLRDRKFTLYNELVFDRDSRNDSAIIMSQLSGVHVVERGIHDILTGFYHFRKNLINETTELGSEIVIKTYYPDKQWDLRIRYAGMETIRTMLGRLACHKYKPVTVVGKYFKHDDDMTIWFTKDEAHIPVKIRLNLKIGAITGELVEHQVRIDD
jgi:hypothetical protein